MIDVKQLTRDLLPDVEALFASCGFEVTRRPSPARVVMRKDL